MPTITTGPGTFQVDTNGNITVNGVAICMNDQITANTCDGMAAWWCGPLAMLRQGAGWTATTCT